MMSAQSLPSLVELANASGSDKGTIHGEGHAYAVLYDLLFAPLRFAPIRIAEFGLQVGGPELSGATDRRTTDVPSVNMWRQYFPAADIVGFDICDFSAFEGQRFTFHRVDCADRTALRSLAKATAPFDVVIDDASHASYHQQATFLEFFPALRGGGVYIIEDVHWQPPAIEAALPACALTRDVFRNLAGSHSGELSDDLRKIACDIASVQLISGSALAALRRDYNARVGLAEHEADRQPPRRGLLSRLLMAREPEPANGRAHPREAKLVVVVKRPDR